MNPDVPDRERKPTPKRRWRPLDDTERKNGNRSMTGSMMHWRAEYRTCLPLEGRLE